jgi:hypothetical protein
MMVLNHQGRIGNGEVNQAVNPEMLKAIIMILKLAKFYALM